MWCSMQSKAQKVFERMAITDPCPECAHSMSLHTNRSTCRLKCFGAEACTCKSKRPQYVARDRQLLPMEIIDARVDKDR